ncbi:ribonuclease BN (tRNA processing enzyme) [Streptosporangium album]|uniref:Ribonuclease BN (tRNA processing enzyme) n=1 Tax=Streptosporangium album TaxID=47479 RepID=A0A7W7S207_9ACTN|nr:MBL fold metallo-hydrolase [Streptosporangium album]MBB4942257.1 ribonuclease BN (tRNA processing enzyme) [Streptosporangium album]
MKWMLLTILGRCGAWPDAGQTCSGYLVEHHGFRLLVGLGYATMPRLLERVTADQVDAVFISHEHPDHCADLNPLLRARAFRDDPPAPLPVYSLPGALDAILALDRPGMLTDAYVLHEFTAGSRFDIWPAVASTRWTALPAYDIRHESRKHFTCSPATRTATSPKSTSASTPGRCGWGTNACGGSRPDSTRIPSRRRATLARTI